jgi:hypothetical protein
VTGSRELTDKLAVFSALHKQRDAHGGALTVRHGHCPDGADAYAHEWCEILKGHGVTEESRPADWNKYGKAAGPIRNKAMVDEGGIDIVLAFPRGEARGTIDCVDRARGAGLKVLYG